LKCGGCDERFTSHEIREADLADTNAEHFALMLSKIRRESKGYNKPRPNPQKVLVGSSTFRRCLRKTFPCCFSGSSNAVNY
jgi:hypothetical protein